MAAIDLYSLLTRYILSGAFELTLFYLQGVQTRLLEIGLIWKAPLSLYVF